MMPPDRPSKVDTQLNQPAAGPAPGGAASGPTDASPPQQPTLAAGEPVPGSSGASLVGYSFDDFELLAELGRGGMGMVYTAVQKSLDRVVAVKLLLQEHSHNATVVARFEAEARAAAALAHPNIVNVYQVGQCSVGPYFVMEFIEGRTLEALCAKKPVPVPWVVPLLITICDAIHFAHGKGIIHRDLKPANIMIDHFRRPIIMDFGIAKVAGRPGSLTQQGVIIGTPGYIPPEQAGEDSLPVGPHSDVYSLGAILYALLSGRPPYEDRNPLRVLLKVVAPEMPAPLRSLRPDVPVALERICTKCLQKRPADRYASALALAHDLRQVRAALSAKSGISSKRTALASILLMADSGQPIRLFQGTTILGRSSECDVVLRAGDVSKRHCQIIVQPDQVLVEDLGSANGTFVNGAPVDHCQLRDGDRLSVADHTFQVRLSPPKPESPPGSGQKRHAAEE
jgi:serine/threonine protein kinase